MMKKMRIYKVLSVYIIVGYIISVFLFPLMLKEQLYFRSSRGNIEMLPSEAFTIELSKGTSIEQYFTPKIQRLESIAIKWGSFSRRNTGTATIELINTQTNERIITQNIDVSEVEEGDITTVTAENPIETLYNVTLCLRITADSPKEAAATPLMSKSQQDEQTLFINGEYVEGTLCYEVLGTDYVWTGLHYKKFAAAGFLLVVLWVLITGVRVKQNKQVGIIVVAESLIKYKFLISQLVSRDFKTKYKRSVLGVLWSFLNPLLMMSVQYFVFSTIFRSDIPNYPVYLLIGIVSFNFFSEACGMALTSIIGNANLITKVYVPKYIYPFTRVLSSVINMVISFIPLLIMMIFTRVVFTRAAILSFFFFGCVIIFSLGLGMVLACSMVFFRDTQFLWGVLNTIWMYATPIFYPDTIIPDEFKAILQINPLYHFVKNTRICILDGISPEPIAYVQCFLMAACMLVIGAWIFKKFQDRFVLYL